MKSKISESKYVPTEETKEAQKKLKAVKYPVHAVSSAMSRVKKFNQFQSKLRKKLDQKISSKLNVYRQVRGDGNCFFRAFAFNYITNLNTIYLRQIFNLLDQIKLDSCKLQSIPKEFKAFYDDKLLKSVLKQVWQKQYNFFCDLTKFNYKRSLARLLTQNPYLDFIIILYFRAVSQLALKQKQHELHEFLKGTEMQQIATYGEQSEGVVIDLMSRFLQMNICIYQIRKEEVILYHYRNLRGSINRSMEIHLLFYQNHYDLFEENKDFLQEYNDDKMQEEYYSQISENYIEGVCIQCNKDKQISLQTGLCVQCFNKSKQNLKTFQKDNFIQGYCTQCNRKSKKISEQILMCQECINKLQFSSQNNIPIHNGISSISKGSSNISQSKKQSKCQRCNLLRGYNDMDEQGICYQCLFNKSNSSKGSSKLSQSGLPSLPSKLQYKNSSQISQNDKAKDTKELQNVRDLTKAKIFERSKLLLQCTQCQAKFPKGSQIESQSLCQNCLAKIIKEKEVPTQQIKNISSSSIRPKKCKFCNKQLTSMGACKSGCQNLSSIRRPY